MARTSTKLRAFRALHAESRGFVMPNTWDAGSAVLLAHAGFPAIATTSAGVAFSFGKPDYDSAHARLALTRDQMLARVREIVRATSLPVNGDLEAGYGDRPDDVATTIAMGLEAGRRANLYREAGAVCLYPAGATDLGDIRDLVREIAGPINIVTGLGRARLHPYALLDAGVRRVSLGGAIARSVLGFLRACARELRQHHSIDFTRTQIAQSELNALFAGAAERS